MVHLILPDRSRREEAHSGRRLDRLLMDLGFNPCEVLVTRDRRLLPDDALLNDEDTLWIVPIVHGG
ncbi:MAG TPA: MoaD/ThiS family protein [Methanoregulaceae archaeon]|nr:MoaD/ThiS family protein [Methanoregulaceae archaeon]HOV66939.1 MoaD/ThiS family protein [Methanoregulaceae archaeon]HQJ87286.1 MoaD/ThiS family protein [Methanoregulaceae archaeon]